MKTTATSLYPFVPSGKQFRRSLEFFAALGFRTEWQHDGLAGLRFGNAYFLLQDINVHLKRDEGGNLKPEKETSTPQVSGFIPPPSRTDFPWGREIHFIDLAGVCWHVRQAKAKEADL